LAEQLRLDLALEVGDNSSREMLDDLLESEEEHRTGWRPSSR
jgi:hypothetical protein